MLPAKRRSKLLEWLQEEGWGQVAEFSKRLGVSDMTIRRDLDYLQQAGLVVRARGGAVLPNMLESTVFELSLDQRVRHHVREKRMIARVAARLVKSGESIAFDGSTTGLMVARALPSSMPFTVVTNNLTLAQEMGRRPNVTLFVIGGLVRAEAATTVGPEAARGMAEYLVDRAFVSAKALSAADGLTDINVLEVQVKRSMIEHAKEVVAVVDSSKLGQRAFLRVCHLSSIRRVVTDAGARPEDLEALREAGVDVVVAGPDMEETGGEKVIAGEASADGRRKVVSSG